VKKHTNRKKTGTRITHFIGTTLFFLIFAYFLYKRDFILLIPTIVTPYFFAWVGHFFIEKNKPATFKYPLFSLRGDFKLYFEILLGKQGWKGE
jgi:hypothetical protein